MSTADRSAQIRDVLAGVTSSVRLLFFEQSIGCDLCTPTRQLLEQLVSMNPYLELETLNLILDKDRAAQYGVDRVPSVVVSAPGRDRVRFLGAPFGHELMSLLEAIRLTASGDTGLTSDTLAQLAAVTRPVLIRVFFTPTCVYCPQMVNLANRLATASAQVTSMAIDASEYPDLVRQYRVNGVPKTVINDAVELVGAVSEADLMKAVLEAIQ